MKLFFIQTSIMFMWAVIVTIIGFVLDLILPALLYPFALIFCILLLIVGIAIIESLTEDRYKKWKLAKNDKIFSNS